MRFSVCLIQPKNYVHSLGLLEVCQLLRASIETLGFPCSLQTNRLEAAAVNIVVGYHLLSESEADEVARHRSVFYQLEQLSDNEGWFNAEREALLHKADWVWDYSEENAAFLKQRGFSRVAHLPLGFHPALSRIRHLPEADKDIDVLFYGSMNPRRKAILEPLSKLCRVRALFGLYGEQRDGWIARSRIVLNLHYYEAKILEQVRLCYLLNNGCCVVSENSDRNPYAEAMVSGPYRELIELCRRLLERPESREQVRARCRDLAEKHPMAENLCGLVEALSAGAANSAVRRADELRLR